MRWIVIAMLAAIIVTLFTALGTLKRPGGDPKRMVRLLTLRVGLSITLFLAIIVIKSGALARFGISF